MKVHWKAGELLLHQSLLIAWNLHVVLDREDIFKLLCLFCWKRSLCTSEASTLAQRNRSGRHMVRSADIQSMLANNNWQTYYSWYGNVISSWLWILFRWTNFQRTDSPGPPILVRLTWKQTVPDRENTFTHKQCTVRVHTLYIHIQQLVSFK